MLGNRQTTKTNLENRQSENFCLTYFCKLNRDQTGKNLRHFETLVEGKSVQKIPKNQHILSWGFACILGRIAQQGLETSSFYLDLSEPRTKKKKNMPTHLEKDVSLSAL